VDARPAKHAAPRARNRKINAELGEECGAVLGHFSRLVAEDHVLARDQAVGYADAKLAGQVIVARARMPELVVTLAARLEARGPGGGAAYMLFHRAGGGCARAGGGGGGRPCWERARGRGSGGGGGGRWFVGGTPPAETASSPAVRARPSSSAHRILARAGSPT